MPHMSRARSCTRIILSLLENAAVLFFSSVPVISSPCPCILHVKPCAYTRPFWQIIPVFQETCFAVNWFAFCGFKRHCGGFAAISTFNVKHPFLGHLFTSVQLNRKDSSYSVGQALAIKENSSGILAFAPL